MRTPTGPFVLPVRDIAHLPGEMREFRLEVPAPARWGEGLVFVAEGTRVDVDVRLESVHEGILVTFTAVADAVGECGRCLADIVEPVEVEFQELFAYSEREADDFEVQDDHVDLETPVRDMFVLSLPFQPVCQPDCLGLDPITGEKLTREAGRDEQEHADPRWAALRQFQAETGEALRAAGDKEDTVTEKS